MHIHSNKVDLCYRRLLMFTWVQAEIKFQDCNK